MALKKNSLKIAPQTSLGLEFDYERLEEELTCPVCLELYADPLMLPCSHSVCKKCVQDILDSNTKKRRSKKEQVHIECPSCRKEVPIGKEKLNVLPRNLALENVVIRYTEERSRGIRNSLNFDPPGEERISTAEESMLGEGGGGGGGGERGSGSCELCDGGGFGGGFGGVGVGAEYNTAAWYCAQCQVRYCHACFAKYHPKRGALAKHKIRPYSTLTDPDNDASSDADETTRNRGLICSEHSGTAAILFCATCQVPACPLCVCEGQGQHGGHRMLGHEVAVKKVEENLKKAKEESDWLVAALVERKGKMEARAEEVKDLHAAAVTRIEQQYRRLVADITATLQQERDRSLDDLLSVRDSTLRATKAYVKESNNLVGKVETLSTACHKLSEAKHPSETLCRAKEVVPLVQKLRSFQQEMESMGPNYDTAIKDKSSMVTLQTAVSRFSKNAMRVIHNMMDDRTSALPSLVPRILTPAATSGNIRASTADLAPRMLNKSLITWGFSSTTFTGERLFPVASGGVGGSSLSSSSSSSSGGGSGSSSLDRASSSSSSSSLSSVSGGAGGRESGQAKGRVGLGAAGGSVGAVAGAEGGVVKSGAKAGAAGGGGRNITGAQGSASSGASSGAPGAPSTSLGAAGSSKTLLGAPQASLGVLGAPGTSQTSQTSLGAPTTSSGAFRASLGATWTVTVERNTGSSSASALSSSGYVFGAGVASGVLGVRDSVGAGGGTGSGAGAGGTVPSYGVVLNSGKLFWAESGGGGKSEELGRLDALPVTVSLAVALCGNGRNGGSGGSGENGIVGSSRRNSISNNGVNNSNSISSSSNNGGNNMNNIGANSSNNIAGGNSVSNNSNNGGNSRSNSISNSCNNGTNGNHCNISFSNNGRNGSNSNNRGSSSNNVSNNGGSNNTIIHSNNTVRNNPTDTSTSTPTTPTDDYVLLSYKIEGQGLSLLGHRVLRDPALTRQIFPVFTVSQRVKLLFPTCV